MEKTMTDETFNLVDRPWIRVRMLDGSTRELSLMDVFARANEVETLANDIVTQDVAILRMLLAVLLRVVTLDVDVDADPIDVWGELWDASELPMEAIGAYLSKWRHRFDLFDDEAPFMQTAGIERKNPDAETGLSPLILDQPDKRRLFSMRSGTGLERMSFQEAARWLVNVHAFDVSGIKFGFKGGRNTDGTDAAPSSRSPAIGVSWAGNIGNLIIEGRNLRETMLLNLVLWNPSEQDDLLAYENDAPAWEQPPSPPGNEVRVPLGPMDLLTWQGRRVLLAHDGDMVIDALVTNGSKVDGLDMRDFENMTAWTTKSRNDDTCKPKAHTTDEAFWHGLAAYVQSKDYDSTDRMRSSNNMVWVRALLDEGRLPRNVPIRMHAVGVEYTAKSTKIQDVIDDTLSMSSYLLSQEGEPLREMVLRCIDVTKNATNAYKRLAEELQMAKGAKEDQAKKQAARECASACFDIDMMFETWVCQLNPETDERTAETDWQRQVMRTLRRMANVLMRNAGSNALIGRYAKYGKKKRLFNATKSEDIFYARLRSYLSLAK